MLKKFKQPLCKCKNKNESFKEFLHISNIIFSFISFSLFIIFGIGFIHAVADKNFVNTKIWKDSCNNSGVWPLEEYDEFILKTNLLTKHINSLRQVTWFYKQKIKIPHETLKLLEDLTNLELENKNVVKDQKNLRIPCIKKAIEKYSKYYSYSYLYILILYLSLVIPGIILFRSTWISNRGVQVREEFKKFNMNLTVFLFTQFLLFLDLIAGLIALKMNQYYLENLTPNDIISMF